MYILHIVFMQVKKWGAGFCEIFMIYLGQACVALDLFNC